MNNVIAMASIVVVSGERLREKHTCTSPQLAGLNKCDNFVNETLLVSRCKSSPPSQRELRSTLVRSGARWGREGATRASVLCWSVRRKHRLAQVWSDSPTRRSSRHSQIHKRRDNGSSVVPTVYAHDAP